MSRVRLEKSLKHDDIYAERSEAENFFEKFITRDVKIAPKSTFKGQSPKKEDKEDILPKKEEKRRKS